MDLHELLTETSHRHKIPLSGCVDLELAEKDGRFFEHVQHYDRWLAQGHAGEMQYLKRGRDRRANPRLLFGEVKSIFSVAIPYPAHPAGSPSPQNGVRYARYIRGQDYHESIYKKIEAVLVEANRHWVEKHPQEELKWKIGIDSSAILERTWAWLCGLGWIGKNNLLMHPKFGSYLFIGVVFLNQTTGQSPHPMPSYCGACTRCIQACPTKALSPYELNSNECISYWTLEKRTPLDFNAEKRSSIGNWVAGCDLCQEACPFNWKAMKAETSAPDDSDTAIATLDWETLLQESEEQYKLRIKNSSLSRVKPQMFQRNLAISLSNVWNGFSAEQKKKLAPLIEKKFNLQFEFHKSHKERGPSSQTLT